MSLERTCKVPVQYTPGQGAREAEALAGTREEPDQVDVGGSGEGSLRVL